MVNDQVNLTTAAAVTQPVRSDPFWTDNFNILYDPDRIIEFFPTPDMTATEKLNALTRFLIYLSILMVVIFHQINYAFIGLIGVCLIYMIHHFSEIDKAKTQEQFIDQVKKEFKISPETPIKVTEKGDVCQLPTPMNPFMNVLISDYTDNPNRPPACPYDDKDAQKLTEKYFDYNLYKNVEDIWEKRNSQREFVTMPGTTIPNDRDSFMKWCWKTTYVCKDGDLAYCLRDEDLRVPGYSGANMII
jgi:hypothetical protein